LTLPDSEKRGDVLEQALRFDLHPCQTVTMLFRGDLLRELCPLADREAADDLGMKIRAAARTRFEFVDEALVIRGSSESHRAAKLEYSDEIWNMIESFGHLYDRFDESVRRDAIVLGYKSKGYRLLQQRWWSVTAIVAFAKALYHRRSADPSLIAALLSAVFGRPIYTLARGAKEQWRTRRSTDRR
jgi:hypothetical protein